VPGQPITPIRLTNLDTSPDGTFQFAFTNVSGTNFSVFATTDLNTPFTNWPRLGSATEIAPGQYQFSDASQNGTNRFYRVSSP
jgi:hypothetical protein